MRMIRLVCLFVFVCLLASCSDDTTNNDTDQDTGSVDTGSSDGSATDASDANEPNDASDTSDTTDATDTTDTTDTSDATDAADTADTSDADEDVQDADDVEDVEEDSAEDVSCGDCDDNNPCTVDECVNGTCENTIDDTLSCNDGDACTQGDTCDATGQCVGTPMDCDDGVACTSDMCSAGVCNNSPDDARCTGGDICDATAGCQAPPECVADADCDDQSTCTVDACVNQMCEYTNDDGATCSDGDACTTGDVCSGGVCAGSAVTCDDSNMCTSDMCNPSTGQCEATPAAGGSCDDGDACTGVDTCDASAGCAGSTELCCGDYIDNDADGLQDCADPDCSADTICQQTWTIGWCKVQWPTSISETSGTVVTVYGHLYAQGLTDQDDTVNQHPNLIAQLGWGADGSDPSLPTSQWTWIAASPNPGWNGGGTNNDEYQADLTVPATGTYDYAYRFSGDGGTTWSYCDTVDNNYSAAEAGNLVAQ